MRASRPYTYLGTVQGMCRDCRAIVPARVLEEDGAVFQERLCPQCGSARARLADDVRWYLSRAATTVECKASLLPGTAVAKGCPHDCGPCAAHANACHLPVFSVTNACNMDCPICFTYNRADQKYFMSRTELRVLLDKLLARVGPLDLLNITGGEPTLHPEILELLRECKRPEIGRITMNSNGLRLASDENLCRALAELGVYVVLSFDTFRKERALKIHGRDVTREKLQALENLQRFGIGTTLLNVMIRGLNDDEIGDIIRLAKGHSVVRSVTVQTMTFTGKGGKHFQPRESMPLDGAAKAIEKAMSGEVRAGDFFPHASAHPLCYSIAYYLKEGERLRSLTDFFNVEELRSMLAGGYLLQPGQDGQDLFRQAIDRLWAEGDPRNCLPAIRGLVERIYPPGKVLSAAERQAAAEQGLLAVYLHSHMDEETLDLARLAVCPDQVPDPEGRLIPACAYNLFYRQKDPLFWFGAPASLPANSKREQGAGRDASAPKRGQNAGRDAGAPSLKPSFMPAIKGTSRVFTQVLPPQPHLGWYSRGYLPHWDQPGMIQCLNFRLVDAMPSEVIDRWKQELGIFTEILGADRALKHSNENTSSSNPKDSPDPHNIKLLRCIAKYEDEGHGGCWLRECRIAQLVEGALLCFDQQRYNLLAWCIMPNHIHAMIETKAGFPLAKVIHSWKSYTASEANKMLGQTGEFWQREYRDRYIRNQEHYDKAIRYIEWNPVKAGLVKLAADWPFSSARFRKGVPASLPANFKEEQNAGKDAGAPRGAEDAGRDAGAPMGEDVGAP
jgi:7,8-dihydro-6-hydroxymethylpterin dimethyltransferase